MSHDQPPTELIGRGRSGAIPDAPVDAAPPPVESPDSPRVLRQPRWSGKKTAVVAALAVGLSSAGAIAAAAASPSTDSVGTGFGQHTGGRNGAPGGQNGPSGLGGSGAPAGVTGPPPNSATTITT